MWSYLEIGLGQNSAFECPFELNCPHPEKKKLQMVKSMSENIKKPITESTRINYLDLQIYFLWVKSS